VQFYFYLFMNAAHKFKQCGWQQENHNTFMAL